MELDVVTGPSVPTYTRDLVSRLGEVLDIRVLTSKSYGASAWNQIYGMLDHSLSLRRRLRPAAIVHVDSQRLGYVAAAKVRNPMVIVCHDVLTFTRQYLDESYESHSLFYPGIQRSLLLAGFEHASAVVCPTEFTRRELRLVRPEFSEKATVIPWGIDRERFCAREMRVARGRLSLPLDTKIVLAVGTESPRKNLERLVRSLASVKERLGVTLVKIGQRREPLRSQLMSTGRSLGVASSMQFVDSVSPTDLPWFFSAADVFVQPSLYEGFGLPPLEAMACGIPVIASRTTSLPEVLGDAARYVSPLDEHDISAAMIEILEDGSVAAELRARGLARAARYSWSATVSAYLSLYETVQPSRLEC